MNDPGMRQKNTVDAMAELGRYLDVTIPDHAGMDMSERSCQEKYFRPQGIMWRKVSLKDRWYEDAIGAMLGTLADGRQVALIPAGRRGYIYTDPDTGRRVKVKRGTASIIQPRATLYYRPLPVRKIDPGDIIRFVRSMIPASEMIIIVLLTIAVLLLSMVTPMMTKLLTSEVVRFNDLRLLNVIVVILILATAATFAVTIMKQLVLARISTKAALPLQAAFMMRVLAAPAGEIKHFNAGDMGTRIGSLYFNLTMLMNMLLSIMLTAACSVICFPQMFYYAVAPACIAFAVTLVLAAIYIRVIRRQAEVSADRMLAQAEESGLTYSLIDGMQKIVVSGAEERAFSLWEKVYMRAMRTIYDPPLILKVFPILTPVIMLAGTILMYPAAVREGVPMPDFYAFLSSYAILTGALTMISSNAVSFANALPVFRVLQPLMDIAPEIGGDREVVEHLQGDLSVRNVSFCYEDSTSPTLDGLDFDIRKGEYVAIVGYTGCGKSTLLKLLLGFEKPDTGEILYDGKDLQSLDVTSLRRHIGTVLQSGEVFQGTILSNIVIAGTDLSEDDAWEAAEIAGIAEDIDRMPMKMNTPLPDGGRGISGGQLQRLLIARAIAPKPEVLFFDEATSALDNVTQKAVTEAIGGMDCTRLVMAHRLSTVQNCDRILCLDRGHIVEEGSYDELMRKDGFFAGLVRRQQI